jgi:hypothetical protein
MRSTPIRAFVPLGAMVLAACALDAAGESGSGDGGSGVDAQTDSTTRPPPDDASSDTTVPHSGDASKDTSEDASGSKDHLSPPDAACVPDAADDPDNCGRCGHSCLGGACTAGTCQPVLLASTSNPLEIAHQDAGTLYWTTSGTMNTVYRCSVSACAPDAVGGCTGTLGIAVDDGHYYFTCYGQGDVYACANAGCGMSGGFGPITGQDYPTGIAVDSTALYWLWQGTAPPPASMHTGQVMMAPLDGGPPTMLRGGQDFPSGMAVQAGVLYWTEPGYNQVSRCTVSDSCNDYNQIATGQNNPDQVTVDPTNAYFTNNGTALASSDGSVVEVNLATKAMTTLASGQGYPRGIVVGASYVYWVNQFAGTVSRVLIGGGSVEVIAKGQTLPVGLAQDDKSLYWTNTGSTGQIMRLAK